MTDPDSDGYDAGSLSVKAARNATSFLARFWPGAALAAVVVLATVLRVYDIVGNPPGFFADEASFGYNAYAVLHTARDEHHQILPLFFRAFGEYKLPVYIYSQIPFIALLGLSELPARLTTAVYGVLTVIATYLLVQALFRDRVLALVAGALLAISPWHIIYSRTGLGDITTHLFFIIMGIYLFLCGTKRPAYWLLAGLSVLLALFSYRAAWVLVPPLIFILTGLYGREIRLHPRYALLGLIIILLGGVAVAWHLLSASTDRAEQQWIFGLHLSFLETCQRFVSQYGTQFTPGFLFYEERVNLRHVVPHVGWLYLWQTPFIFVGVLALLLRPSRPKLLILSLLLLYPLPAAVTKSSPESNRTIVGAVAFSIITAYGILAVGRFAGSWRWSRFPELGKGLAVLFATGTATAAVVGLLSFLDTYHGAYKQDSVGYFGWQWGSREIVERFVAEEKNYDRLVLDSLGTFNEAELLLRFYAPHDCRPCIVGYGNPDDYLKKNELFVYRPEMRSLENDYAEKGTLYYANGGIAFRFVEPVRRVTQPTTPPPTRAPTSGRCDPTNGPNQWLCFSASFSLSFTRVEVAIGKSDNEQQLNGVTFDCTFGPGAAVAGVFQDQAVNDSADFPFVENWSADFPDGCQVSIAVVPQPADATSRVVIQKIVFR